MKLKLKNGYDVLGKTATMIVVGKYKEETSEYFNCELYNSDNVLLSQYRYFTKDDIPANELID